MLAPQQLKLHCNFTPQVTPCIKPVIGMGKPTYKTHFNFKCFQSYIDHLPQSRSEVFKSQHGIRKVHTVNPFLAHKTLHDETGEERHMMKPAKNVVWWNGPSLPFALRTLNTFLLECHLLRNSCTQQSSPKWRAWSASPFLAVLQLLLGSERVSQFWIESVTTLAFSSSPGML